MTDIRLSDLDWFLPPHNKVECMKLILPLPGYILSPNARPHFHPKAKATREYRWIVMVAAQAWCSVNEHTFPWQEATIQLTYHFEKKARRDPDNLLFLFKAGFDGLRDAGILMDDDLLTHLPVKKFTGSKDPRLEMEVMR